MVTSTTRRPARYRHRRLRDRRRGRPRGDRPPPRSRPGGTPRWPSAPPSCSRSASCSSATQASSPRSDQPSTARSSPTRRRGQPRPGGRRVRLRHPASAQGRVHRERLDRRRRLLDPPAARRGRRHHAVQLPGHGADVVLPDRDRRGQHLRAQAVREGPVGVAVAGRAARPRPACPPACSTSCTATRPPSTRC